MNPTLETCATRTTRWPFFQWYWGDAIAIDGLLAAGHSVPQATEHATRAITRWYRSCPDNLDDALAPGRAIIDLATTGQIPAPAASRFIHAIDRLPTTADGIPLLEPHRPAFRFGVCIDAVYHLPPALAADGRRRSDTRQIRRAATMAGNIMNHLACHGGWAQWYDAAIGRNNAMAWSRGLGWALLGLLDLARIAADTPGVEQCVDTAGKIMALLSATIDDDGTWPSLLHDPAAEHETSTSAFFLAAAHHPALDHAARPRPTLIEAARRAVYSHLSADGTLHGASADILPSFNPAPYQHFTTEPSPWAQGALLRAMRPVAAVE